MLYDPFFHRELFSGQISLLLDRFPEAVADLVKAAELRPDFALATVQVNNCPSILQPAVS